MGDWGLLGSTFCCYCQYCLLRCTRWFFLLSPSEILKGVLAFEPANKYLIDTIKMKANW